MSANTPLEVVVLMGSASDWPTMEHTHKTLNEFGIVHECRAMSAHRTPGPLVQFVEETQERGAKVYIAAAGGAAHLAGVVAAHTVLPVLGVPIESNLLGLDSLLSTVQMPKGIPVATFAVGKAGAINAALSAVAILATSNQDLQDRLKQYRENNAQQVLAQTLPVS